MGTALPWSVWYKAASHECSGTPSTADSAPSVWRRGGRCSVPASILTSAGGDNATPSSAKSADSCRRLKCESPRADRRRAPNAVRPVKVIELLFAVAERQWSPRRSGSVGFELTCCRAGSTFEIVTSLEVLASGATRRFKFYLQRRVFPCLAMAQAPALTLRAAQLRLRPPVLVLQDADGRSRRHVSARVK